MREPERSPLAAGVLIILLGLLLTGCALLGRALIGGMADVFSDWYGP